VSYEQRDGQGALFKNDEKHGERDPDYRGNIKINGQEYWLSAWLKTSKEGKKFMSLSAQPKMARDTPGAVAHKESFRDDDISF
jgi:uncharacterized protein (DUF736 family)